MCAALTTPIMKCEYKLYQGMHVGKHHQKINPNGTVASKSVEHFHKDKNHNDHHNHGEKQQKLKRTVSNPSWKLHSLAAAPTTTATASVVNHSLAASDHHVHFDCHTLKLRPKSSSFSSIQINAKRKETLRKILEEKEKRKLAEDLQQHPSSGKTKAPALTRSDSAANKFRKILERLHFPFGANHDDADAAACSTKSSTKI